MRIGGRPVSNWTSTTAPITATICPVAVAAAGAADFDSAAFAAAAAAWLCVESVDTNLWPAIKWFPWIDHPTRLLKSLTLLPSLDFWVLRLQQF